MLKRKPTVNGKNDAPVAILTWDEMIKWENQFDYYNNIKRTFGIEDVPIMMIKYPDKFMEHFKLDPEIIKNTLKPDMIGPTTTYSRKPVANIDGLYYSTEKNSKSNTNVNVVLSLLKKMKVTEDGDWEKHFSRESMKQKTSFKYLDHINYSYSQIIYDKKEFLPPGWNLNSTTIGDESGSSTIISDYDTGSVLHQDDYGLTAFSLMLLGSADKVRIRICWNENTSFASYRWQVAAHRQPLHCCEIDKNYFIETNKTQIQELLTNDEQKASESWKNFKERAVPSKNSNNLKYYEFRALDNERKRKAPATIEYEKNKRQPRPNPHKRPTKYIKSKNDAIQNLKVNQRAIQLFLSGSSDTNCIKVKNKLAGHHEKQKSLSGEAAEKYVQTLQQNFEENGKKIIELEKMRDLVKTLEKSLGEEYVEEKIQIQGYVSYEIARDFIDGNNPEDREAFIGALKTSRPKHEEFWEEVSKSEESWNEYFGINPEEKMRIPAQNYT
uniref:Uncharacterized protein n=1 Tax=Panagrolaimus sp. ES5 TaxID=591445 RepID=A0AC34GN73_9BILA